MPSVLKGKIVHRFDLPSPSNKRPDTDKSKRCLVNNSTNPSNECGFIFIPQPKLEPHREYLLSFPKRLLKLACDAARLDHKVLIRRYAEIPFIESSDALEYAGGRGSPPSSSSPPPSLPSAGNCMIEVHDLEIIREEGPAKTMSEKISDQNRNSTSNLWKLTQFWRKERLDFQKMKNSRPKFSLVATVDAVSPIVALDPSNPFALIEVYDSENTDITCVVVLHGKQAVLKHEAIHPLDTLVFHDVTYKPWSVHKILRNEKADEGSVGSTAYRQFLGRVPSHVFVATKSDSVMWGNEDTASTIGKTWPSSIYGQSERDQKKIPPSITPNNLVSTIVGEIFDVRTISVSIGHTRVSVIHYLDMVLLKQSTCGGDNVIDDEHSTSRLRCRLYLSHFPMSMALQCSLRIGGIVQAYNVHRICSDLALDIDDAVVTFYGACLRSTLILVEHASDAVASSTGDTTQTTDTGTRKDSISSFSTQPCGKSELSVRTSSAAWHQIRPDFRGQKEMDTSFRHNKDSSIGCPLNFSNFGFRKIKQTYVEDLHFERVKDWERQSFLGSSRSTLFERKVPRAWIVSNLLDNNQDIGKRTNIFSGSGDHAMGSVSLKANHRASIRSPYAEFFDHSFALRVNDDEPCVEDPSCSCHLSIQDRQTTSLRSSAMLGLNEIRVKTQRYFENHISDLLHSSRTSQKAQQSFLPRKGFHGSFRIPLDKLYGGKESDDKSTEDYFVGGFVSEVHLPRSSIASIADGECHVPISFNQDLRHANVNDFCMGQLDFVMISCLCLGNRAAENGTYDSNENVSMTDPSAIQGKSISLPSIDSSEIGLLSNCSMVTIDGFIFITAIQLHCSDLRLHEGTVSVQKAQNQRSLEEINLTVEGCLTTTNVWLSKSSKPNNAIGMLTRCRFHSKVNADGSHKCSALTVSSFRRNKLGDIESDDSCLQALELTVSVVQSTGRLAKFNETISTSRPILNLTGSQKILATSFWVLGDSGRTCAMTFGGSEDIVLGSSCSKSRIMITFPTSSTLLSKRGYTRSLCTHDCLDAFFENWQSSDEDAERSDNFSKDERLLPFDFVGVTTVPSGMLPRRPSRRTIFRSETPPLRTVGELSTTFSNAIPLNTLSDLFELIFQDLQATNSSQSIMNPSLVRRISNGRFLGVSFCQVQCYCTQCFYPLVKSSSNRASETSRMRKRRRSDSFDEPSFWHLPHPEESLAGTNHVRHFASIVTEKSTQTLPRHIQSSKFKCLKNGCPKNKFGVKWECSGVLDDGTGQATMYADGDAALTLLGMSAEAIQIIEEGVWSTRDGSIQFMRSIPPPKELREKVVSILATQRGNGYKKPTMVDPLQLLSIQDRASYLLEKHCRSSSRPRRPLDYYVRCKPLGNKENAAPHLRHTTIDAFLEEPASENGSSNIYRGQVASYTIPSLKLELVDCSVKSPKRSFTNFE